MSIWDIGDDMSDWRFVETEEDGQLWLKNPSELHAVIDFRSEGDKQRHQIMVVTKTWVDRQLAVLGNSHGGRVVFSAMLVIADASAHELKASIDAALSQGGLEHFASLASE